MSAYVVAPEAENDLLVIRHYYATPKKSVIQTWRIEWLVKSFRAFTP